MKMVKNLITSIIIGSTALAMPMMANAAAEDGAFKVSERAARNGVNPRTGESIKIPE